MMFCSRYETSNGIAQEETGQVFNEDLQKESITVRDSFRYMGSDGVVYNVN